MKEWWKYGCNGQGNQKGIYPIYKKHYPEEAKEIIRKAEELIPLPACPGARLILRKPLRAHAMRDVIYIMR